MLASDGFLGAIAQLDDAINETYVLHDPGMSCRLVNYRAMRSRA